MRGCWCDNRDFSNLRKRRATLFHLIAQLELISTSEEVYRNRLGDNRLRPDVLQDANRRISLLDSAIDSLLAIYPSRFGGEPF
jgi:hypothetical protein